jgi:two-component sensor histidine kinase
VVSLFAGETHIVVEKRFDDIILGSKVLFPLGLIVNEIVTNMIKHAFAGRESGTLRISASREGKQVTVVLEDDGSGLSPGFDVNAAKGFGLTLVRMLCDQLDARLGVENITRGTRWSMVFEAE